MHKRSFRIMAAAVVAGAMMLTGCAAQTPTASSGGSAVQFQLNTAWNASSAGFAVAQAGGYYSDAGIDVQVIPGTGSGTAAQLVASGQADMGVADATAIGQLIDKGAPLVIVATDNQVTNIAIQTLASSGISSPEDLRGKTIGLAEGGAWSFLLPLFLEQNGFSEQDVSISTLPFASLPAALLQSNVDAIVGGQDTAVALELQNADYNNFWFKDSGVSPVAHSIFTTRSFADENPDVVSKIVAASLRGWAETIDDPESAVSAVKQLQSDSKDDVVRAELRLLLPLMCAGDAPFVGRAEPDRWVQSNEIWTQAGLLPAPLDISTSVSYDFLPPESELHSCE